jgi:chaperone LolA
LNTLVFVVFSIYLLTPELAFANGGMKLVKSTIERYQKAKAVEVELKKTVTLNLLDDVKKSDGTMLLSKGLMRLEIKKPEESLIVLGKDALWVVTPTPAELGGKTQVMKIKSKELSKQSKAPIAALLGNTKAWDQLKIKKDIIKDGTEKISLVPIRKSALGDIVKIDIEISKSDKSLKKFSYIDELENETSYEFINSNFDAQVTDASFNYVPPKNAEVSEY